MNYKFFLLIAVSAIEPLVVTAAAVSHPEVRETITVDGIVYSKSDIKKKIPAVLESFNLVLEECLEFIDQKIAHKDRFTSFEVSYLSERINRIAKEIRHIQRVAKAVGLKTPSRDVIKIVEEYNAKLKK